MVAATSNTSLNSHTLVWGDTQQKQLSKRGSVEVACTFSDGKKRTFKISSKVDSGEGIVVEELTEMWGMRTTKSSEYCPAVLHHVLKNSKSEELSEARNQTLDAKREYIWDIVKEESPFLSARLIKEFFEFREHKSRTAAEQEVDTGKTSQHFRNSMCGCSYKETELPISDEHIVSMVKDDPEKVVLMVERLPDEAQQAYLDKISRQITSEDFLQAYGKAKKDRQLPFLMKIIGTKGVSRLINDGTIPTLAKSGNTPEAKKLLHFLSYMPDDAEPELIQACFHTAISVMDTMEALEGLHKKYPQVVWDSLQQDAAMNDTLQDLLAADMTKAFIIINILSEHQVEVVNFSTILDLLTQVDEINKTKEQRHSSKASHGATSSEDVIRQRREKCKQEWSTCAGELLTKEAKSYELSAIRWQPEPRYQGRHFSHKGTELHKVTHSNIKLPQALQTLAKVMPHVADTQSGVIEKISEFLILRIESFNDRRMWSLTLAIIIEHSRGQVKEQIINRLYRQVLLYPKLDAYVKVHFLEFIADQQPNSLPVEQSERVLQQAALKDARAVLAAYQCLPSLMVRKMLVLEVNALQQTLPQKDIELWQLVLDNTNTSSSDQVVEVLADTEQELKFKTVMERTYSSQRYPSAKQVVDGLDKAMASHPADQHAQLIMRTILLIDHLQSLQTGNVDFMAECFVNMPIAIQELLLTADESITHLSSQRKLQLLDALSAENVMDLFKQSARDKEASESASYVTNDNPLRLIRNLVAGYAMSLKTSYQSANKDSEKQQIKKRASVILSGLSTEGMLTGRELNEFAQVLGDDFASACSQIPWATLKQLLNYRTMNVTLFDQLFEIEHVRLDLMQQYATNEFLVNYFSADDCKHKAELAKQLKVEQRQAYLTYLKTKHSEHYLRNISKVILSIALEHRSQFLRESFGEQAESLQDELINNTISRHETKPLKVPKLVYIASMLDAKHRQEFFGKLPSDTSKAVQTGLNNSLLFA